MAYFHIPVSGHVPKITVAIPVFNAGCHLRLAVLSIVCQSFKNWELLIIDDGSTDDALLTISDIHDPRIRILRDGYNKGLACRLNQAIDLARGQFFARMDQDDVSYPDRFACQLALLERDPNLDMVAVRAVTISDDNALAGKLPYALAHRDICIRPWLGFYLPHPTWMGSLAWFRAHRYICPGPYFCEDQDLLLRSYDKSRFVTVDRVLFAYRIRSKINLKKQTKTRWTLLNIQLQYFYNYKQLFFALLSLVAFVGRVACDLMRVFLQTSSWSRGSRKSQSSNELSEWQGILKQLSEKSEPP